MHVHGSTLTYVYGGIQESKSLPLRSSTSLQHSSVSTTNASSEHSASYFISYIHERLKYIDSVIMQMKALLADMKNETIIGPGRRHSQRSHTSSIKAFWELRLPIRTGLT